MSDQIFIDYEAVYTSCREWRRRLQTEVRDVDAEYRQIQSSLQNMDGRANAQMIEAVGANQGNIQLTVETLLRLLDTMESTAQAVEQEELRVKQMFNMVTSSRTQNSVVPQNSSNDVPSPSSVSGGDNNA